jgi:hypothetical protein
MPIEIPLESRILRKNEQVASILCTIPKNAEVVMRDEQVEQNEIDGDF